MTHSILGSRRAALCTLPRGLQCIARVPVDAESGSAAGDGPLLYSCPCHLCIGESSDQNARGSHYAYERCAHGWSAA